MSGCIPCAMLLPTSRCNTRRQTSGFSPLTIFLMIYRNSFPGVMPSNKKPRGKRTVTYYKKYPKEKEILKCAFGLILVIEHRPLDTTSKEDWSRLRGEFPNYFDIVISKGMLCTCHVTGKTCGGVTVKGENGDLVVDELYYAIGSLLHLMKPAGIFIVQPFGGADSDDTEAMFSGFEANFEVVVKEDCRNFGIFLILRKPFHSEGPYTFNAPVRPPRRFCRCKWWF